ncbi:TetR family transcriptional regulator C-terminal domain-containing protein [Bacteroidota bacterium]
METQKKITKKEIITNYMEFVLSKGRNPHTVYQFATDLNIEESTFYKFYSSFEQLEKDIFTLFFKNSIELLEKSIDYKDFDARNKVLSFYFTFIEILTANRSYVILSLNKEKNKLKSIKKLTGLKFFFNDFIKDLAIEKIDFKEERIGRLQDKGTEELFWVQLLFILKFWLEDSSSSFEKTDIFIEKTVHATFDAIHTKPIKSFIDLGKFLLKEKIDFKI